MASFSNGVTLANTRLTVCIDLALTHSRGLRLETVT